MLESFVLVALFVVVVGLVGWYPGETQHGHTSLNDGGILTTYPTTFSQSGTPVQVSNTAVETSVFSVLVPSGTMSIPGKRIRMTVEGDLLQQTGVAAAEPKFLFYWAGSAFSGHITPILSLASSANLRSWSIAMEFAGHTVNDNSSHCQTLMKDVNDQFDAAPLLNLYGNNAQMGQTTNIDATLEFRIQNAVANANYRTTLRSVLVEQF
jgi:hypothetical protein